ncbi:MAG TPA: crotonase [Firmicutes bacterium]|nr:crotonase [Bacillota bacterium]
MAYEYVLLEKDGCLAIITINRPKALNALNADVLRDLQAAVRAAHDDPEVAVLIITGAGEKAFVAGADIAFMQDMSPQEARPWTRMGQAIFAEIENLDKPVIAAVNGFALGGGCELAMACDIRVASEKARFGQPEVNLGIIPGFGGTQRLPRLVGKGMAKRLIFSGDMIDAATAERIGLADMVVPVDELMAKTKELAMSIAAKGPTAIKLAKAAINRGLELDLAAGVDYEAEVFALCFATADQKEGMKAFLEKRKPEFTGK